jgi:hypothetical protein
MIRENPSWGRTRLSEKVCECFSWYQANGRLKDRACRVALLKLESLGYLKLPQRKQDGGGRPPSVEHDPIISESQIHQMPVEIELRYAQDRSEKRLWNSLISKYHYLGLSTPVGRLIRYLIYGDGNLLGAISFSESAWNVGPRNQLLSSVGIPSDSIRDVVIGNNRFLILPFVRVPNLASRILGQSLRRVIHDWEDRFSCCPLIAETFVDPTRYLGTCYLASNWVNIGESKGFTKRGASHLNQKAPKLILLRGLNSSIHQKLQSLVKKGIERAA